MEKLQLDNVKINQIREACKALNATGLTGRFIPLYGQSKVAMGRKFAAAMKPLATNGGDKGIPAATLELYHAMTGNGEAAKPKRHELTAKPDAPVDNLDAIAIATSINVAAREEKMLAIAEVMKLFAPATPKNLVNGIMHEIAAHIGLFEKLGLTFVDVDGCVHFK
jgi:hypothetical protein